MQLELLKWPRKPVLETVVTDAEWEELARVLAGYFGDETTSGADLAERAFALKYRLGEPFCAHTQWDYLLVPTTPYVLPVWVRRGPHKDRWEIMSYDCPRCDREI